MVLNEIHGNLFNAQNCYYVQCISADFGMGKGIAVEFNNHFDMKNKVVTKYGSYVDKWDNSKDKGFCLLEDCVFNLITKRNYWLKPTYETLENSLWCMRKYIEENHIQKIVMPKIGCGLDRLDWNKVKEILSKVFDNMNIEIEVYYL